MTSLLLAVAWITATAVEISVATAAVETTSETVAATTPEGTAMTGNNFLPQHLHDWHMKGNNG